MTGDIGQSFEPKGNAGARVVLGVVITAASMALLALPWIPAEPAQNMSPITRWQSRVLGGFGLSVGLLLCYLPFRSPRVRVSVDPDGLTLFDGERRRSCRWEEVIELRETVRLGAPYEPDNFGVIMAKVKGEEHMLTLRDKAGQELVFKNVVTNFPALVGLAKEKTLPFLLPPARAALLAGGSLRFGGVAVDQQRVRVKDKGLSWSEVEAFTVEHGLVRIRKRGNWMAWAKVPLTDTPNAHVLVAVAQARLGARGREA